MCYKGKGIILQLLYYVYFLILHTSEPYKEIPQLDKK